MKRFIISLLLSVVVTVTAAQAQPVPGSGIDPSKNGSDFLNPAKVRQNLGAAPYSRLSASPTLSWGAANGFISGSTACNWSMALRCSLARLSDGSLSVLNSDGSWGLIENAGGTLVQHTPGIGVCDIGTWKVCYATTRQHSKYIGISAHAAHVVGTDGQGTDIDFITNAVGSSMNWGAIENWRRLHGPYLFVAMYHQYDVGGSNPLVAAYDQNLNEAGTPDFLALTVIGTNLKNNPIVTTGAVPSTTPAGTPTVGLYIYSDDPNNSCTKARITSINLEEDGTTSAPGKIIAKTFDGAQSCALASGRKVMLTRAFVLPPRGVGDVGTMPSFMADQPYDGRKTYNQVLNIPNFAGGAIASDSTDVLFSFRAASYGSAMFYSCPYSGGGSNKGEYFYSANATILHRITSSDGSGTSSDSFIPNNAATHGGGSTRATVTAGVGGKHVNGSNIVTAWLNEQYANPNPHAIGSDTIQGCAIGGANITGANPNVAGGVAYGFFGIALKLSDADYAQARGALIMQGGINPQAVDPQITFVRTDYALSSINDYLTDVPWLIANRHLDWRVTSGGWFPVSISGGGGMSSQANPAKYPIRVQYQVNDRIKPNIGLIGASVNDYGNPTQSGINGSISVPYSGGAVSNPTILTAGDHFMPGTYKMVPQAAGTLPLWDSASATISGGALTAVIGFNGGSGMANGTFQFWFGLVPGCAVPPKATYAVASGVANGTTSIVDSGSGCADGQYPVVPSGAQANATFPDLTYTANSTGSLSSVQCTICGTGLDTNTTWSHYGTDPNVVMAVYDKLLSSMPANGFTDVIVLFAPKTSHATVKGDTFRLAVQNHIKAVSGIHDLARTTPDQNRKAGSLWYLDANDIPAYQGDWGNDLTFTNIGGFDLTSRGMQPWANQVDEGLQKLVLIR